MELALRVMGYVVSGNATFLVKIHKKFVEELTPLLSKEYDLVWNYVWIYFYNLGLFWSGN